MNQKKTGAEGATILELIIVLAVFAIMIAVVAGIFISSIERQKFLLKEQEITNQINFAIEYMSRKIANVATDTTGSCLGESYVNNDYLLTHKDSQTQMHQGVLFLSKDGACYNFYLSGNTIEETKTISQTQTKTLLAGNFTIQHLRFILNGSKAVTFASERNTTQIQPRITMALSIRITAIKDPGMREKLFQTTIEKRHYWRRFR